MAPSAKRGRDGGLLADRGAAFGRRPSSQTSTGRVMLLMQLGCLGGMVLGMMMFSHRAA
jgi:hypothetical protein